MMNEIDKIKGVVDLITSSTVDGRTVISKNSLKEFLNKYDFYGSYEIVTYVRNNREAFSLFSIGTTKNYPYITYNGKLVYFEYV